MKTATPVQALSDEGFFLKAIHAAARDRIAVIANEEIELAMERISERAMQEVDNLALHILREYDIRTNGETMTITVRKIAK